MSAYVIVEVDVIDPEQYARYGETVPGRPGGERRQVPGPRRGDGDARGGLAAQTDCRPGIRRPRGGPTVVRLTGIPRVPRASVTGAATMHMIAVAGV